MTGLQQRWSLDNGRYQLTRRPQTGGQGRTAHDSSGSKAEGREKEGCARDGQSGHGDGDEGGSFGHLRPVGALGRSVRRGIGRVRCFCVSGTGA